MIPKRLTVITHVDHYKNDQGKLFAYEPYVREMDLWCELFVKVVIFAPSSRLCDNIPLIEFKYANVEHRQLFYNNSSNRVPSFQIRLFNRIAPFIRLFQFPLVFCRLFWVIARSEFVLVRSPGLPALAANIALKILNKNSIVKWAGGYHAYPKERFFSKFERKLVAVPRTHNRVLVYDQVKIRNFEVFMPALMSDEEIISAFARSENKNWDGIINILSVGRLHPAKGYDMAIKALNLVKNKYKIGNWHYYLVGDGAFHDNLRDLIEQYDMSREITMIGNKPFSEVLDYYARANIVIMPGTKEGWPKVIAEAWAHQALVLAAECGNVADILSRRSGIPFNSSPEDLALALKSVLNKEIDYRQFIEQGKKEIMGMSLEKFKEKIAALCCDIMKGSVNNG